MKEVFFSNEPAEDNQQKLQPHLTEFYSEFQFIVKLSGPQFYSCGSLSLLSVSFLAAAAAQRKHSKPPASSTCSASNSKQTQVS